MKSALFEISSVGTIKEKGDSDVKVLYKFMNNVVYGETIENLRNAIDVKLVSNVKDYWKRTSKRRYMSQKIFDDDLAPIHKSEVTLTLIKTAYVGMDIIDLSNVLML